MDTIQEHQQRQENFILKSNLWKFFKSLRVQANPIYCLLMASPIHYAWITIFNKIDPNKQKRLTISQFVNSLKKMPSGNTYYQLNIHLYSPISENLTIEKSLQNKQIYEANYQHELSITTVEGLLCAIVAFHCMEAIKKGERLELTPEIIQFYKFKTRYLEEMDKLIKQCNDSILKNLHFN